MTPPKKGGGPPRRFFYGLPLTDFIVLGVLLITAAVIFGLTWWADRHGWSR